MNKQEYRVYHRNSPARTVAVTPILAYSPKDACNKARHYAVRWNMENNRPLMVVSFLECEGEKLEIRDTALPLFDHAEGENYV